MQKKRVWKKEMMNGRKFQPKATLYNNLYRCITVIYL